ncbi:MAG: cytochrome c biosis protein CcmH, partial [Actinomycetota bacterium]
MSRSSVNRAIKRWPSWVVLLVVAVVMLAVGIGRDSGPATAEERIDAIAQRLACPTCDGESVYESRGSASQAIRQEIAR